MSTINTQQSAAVGAAPTAAAASPLSGGMTQNDFLKLMTAQLQAQDPTNPVDNSQFVSQMAQFSQLSATQGLQTTLNSLSSSLSSAVQTSQVLSSTNLVDRSVLVPSATLSYAGDAVGGAVNVTTAGPAVVNVLDVGGNVLRQISLGSQPVGVAQFSWDGTDADGNAVPTGSYSMVAGNGSSQFDTYAAGKVTAVGYGGTGLGTTLQVAGVGAVPLSQVAQIL